MVYNGLEKLITLIKENPYYGEEEEERKSYDYDNLSLLSNLGKISYRYTLQNLNTIAKIKAESVRGEKEINYHFANAVIRDALYMSKMYEPMVERLCTEWPYMPILIGISVILLIPLLITAIVLQNKDVIKSTGFFVAFAFDCIPFLTLLLTESVDKLHGIYYQKILFLSENAAKWSWVELAKKGRMELSEFVNSTSKTYLRKTRSSIYKALEAGILKNLRLQCEEEDGPVSIELL